MTSDDDPPGRTVAAVGLEDTAISDTRRPIGTRPDAPQIGRYRIRRRLGAGGMGVVYLAHDPDLDRQIAIKVLHTELRTERRRLLREGQAIAKLTHPNVVAVHDVGTEGDELFIAMEYVAGTTLGGWLATGRRPWPDVLARFTAAGRGLAAAHAVGLIHRDFKPDNVLLDDAGRVVVSDFGLARIEERDPSVGRPAPKPPGRELVETQLGVLLGTPAYMSPEQFLGKPADARSDQFSFCVALWEGAYGARPFEGGDGPGDLASLSSAVLGNAIRPPPADRDVPAWIERALRRGLSVDPGARFASMDALLAMLRPRDRRPLWIGGGVAALAIAGVAAVVIARDDGTAAPAAGPDCAAEAARVHEVWNPAAREAYLARPGEPPDLADDVRWFEQVATEWRTAARTVCGQPRTEATPRRETCLEDALDQLRLAIGRDNVEVWPIVPQVSACSGATSRPEPRVRDIRTGLPENASAVLSPDADEVALTVPDGERVVIPIDRGTAPSRRLVGISRVESWLVGDRVLGLDDHGRAVHVDLATGATEVEPARDERWGALSPDGAIAVLLRARECVFIERATGKALATITGCGSSSLGWEPGTNRCAWWAEDGDVEIFDPRTGASSRIRYRLDASTLGVLTMIWPSPGILLIHGSTDDQLSEGIWSLRIDERGTLAGALANIVPVRGHTAYQLLDAKAGVLLAAEIDLAVSVNVSEGGQVSRFPAGREGIVISGDSSGRVMLHDDQLGSVVTLLDAGGAVVTQSDRKVGLRDGRLALLQSTGTRLELIELGDGDEQQVIATGVTEVGGIWVLRCSAWTPTSCVAIQFIGDDVQVRPIIGTELGPTRSLPAGSDSIDIAADGTRVLTTGPTGVVTDVDLTTGVTATLHREDGCAIQRALWGRDGASIYYSAICGGHYALRERRADGTIRTLVEGDSWISGFAVTGDDRVVFSTQSWRSKLIAIDGLPGL